MSSRWYRDRYGDVHLWITVTFTLVGILAGSMLLLAPILAGVGQLAERSCRETSAALGLDWQWGYFVPCQVDVDGKWVPLDAYRATDEVSR